VGWVSSAPVVAEELLLTTVLKCQDTVVVLVVSVEAGEVEVMADTLRQKTSSPSQHPGKIRHGLPVHPVMKAIRLEDIPHQDSVGRELGCSMRRGYHPKSTPQDSVVGPLVCSMQLGEGYKKTSRPV